jgi:RNA polymerase sigma-70 factor (ECF subfamily)
MISLEEIVERHYSNIFHLVLSILDDADDAEDVTQETFIAAGINLNGYRGEADIKTWLYSIAINRSRGYLRKRKSSRTLNYVLDSIQRLTNRSPGPEEETLINEMDEQLWNIVDSLGEKHRLPIILRYVHQLKIPEIARILEVKKGTIHSRLHYAHQKIRGELKRITPTQLENREVDK